MALGLLLFIFMIDLIVPLGVAIGVLYVISLFFLLPISNTRIILWMALFAAFLTLLALFFQLKADTNWMTYVNRFISLTAIGVVAFLMTKFKTDIFAHQTELEKSRQRIQSMVAEVVDYAIILLDIEGNVESWNKGARNIKGYSEEEILGKNFRLFYDENDQNSGKPDRLINIARREGLVRDEGWRKRKNGSKFWGRVTITAIHDKEGKVTGFTKVTRDLTSQREAELRERQTAIIEAKNKELEQFTYLASHDLQSPLATVSNYAKLLDEEYHDQLDEDARTFLQFMLEAIERMRVMINDLLEYSRIGRHNQDQVWVDTGEIVNHAVANLAHIISESGATIDTEELPKVRAYKTELILLFQNLISNAIKFRREGVDPYIRISAEDKSTHWRFAVYDNGIGIEEAYIDKIFDAFQRLHSKKQYAGTGIGLAHCQKILDLHGGRIWVESKLNEGSTFCFTIPI